MHGADVMKLDWCMRLAGAGRVGACRGLLQGYVRWPCMALDARGREVLQMWARSLGGWKDLVSCKHGGQEEGLRVSRMRDVAGSSNWASHGGPSRRREKNVEAAARSWPGLQCSGPVTYY